MKSWSSDNQMRSVEWIQLTGKTLHGSIYLWSVMKKSSVSCTRRFTYVQILRYALERWTRTHNQILHGEDRLTWFKGSPQYRALEHSWWLCQWNSSGIFPRIQHIAALRQSPRVPVKMSEEPEEFTGRIIFMSMFNDISWRSKDNEQECELNANLVSICARRFFTREMVIPRTWIRKEVVFCSWQQTTREWDRVADLMMLKFGESGHPVFRSTSPPSRGVLKSKGGGKLSLHFCVDEGTIETVFRTIISVTQLSIHGASLRFVWGTQRM